MRKYTQKELRELVRIGAAHNISNYGFKEMRDFNNLVKAGWDHISARWIVVCSWAKYTGDNCDKCDITQKILTGKFLEQCKIKDMFA